MCTRGDRHTHNLTPESYRAATTAAGGASERAQLGRHPIGRVQVADAYKIPRWFSHALHSRPSAAAPESGYSETAMHACA